MPDTPPIDDRRAPDPWRQKMETIVAENTEITLETKGKVDDVHEILVAAKGAFKVLGWLGVAAKWIGVIAATVTTVLVLWYQVTHGGELPKK